jgi:hypothetical protein
MDRINMAVVEQGGIELGGLFGVAIEPEARGYARHGDFPPKNGGVGGLIGSLYPSTAGTEGHAAGARDKKRVPK